VHREREDVNAAVHAHGVYGKAWSCFARRLEMLNQDVALFYGEAQAVYEVPLHFPILNPVNLHINTNVSRNSTALCSPKKKASDWPRRWGQKAKA
jgi:ribulose-5-phosphate 4-epimerase/fuculose-1-phosphate aldolase